MYQVGDVVRHPNAGVCEILEIREQRFGNLPPRQYYILKPLYAKAATTVYTPVDSPKVPLRKLLNEEELDSLLAQVPEAWLVWQENETERHARFGEILHGSDLVAVIRLIVLLHEKQKERQAQGKQLRVGDKKYLEEAKRLLHQEFAYAKDLDPEQVPGYIMGKLGLE